MCLNNRWTGQRQLAHTRRARDETNEIQREEDITTKPFLSSCQNVLLFSPRLFPCRNSCEDLYIGPVYTYAGKFENRGFTVKTHQMLPVSPLLSRRNLNWLGYPASPLLHTTQRGRIVIELYFERPLSTTKTCRTKGHRSFLLSPLFSV